MKNMNTNKKRILFFAVLSIILCFSLVFNYVNETNSLFATTTGEYVAQDPCSENDIRKVLRLFGYLLLIAKIAVPFIIIGYGTFDLFKSVVDKDEKSLTKQLKQLGIRILTGLIVFFIPNIVYALFSVSDKLGVINTSDYKECANCLLEPTNNSKCHVD